MEKKEQWQYYISSYMRIEHTEGVVRSRLQKVLLERNLPSGAGNDASDDGYAPKPLVVHEGLVLRICLLSYKIVYEKGTSDYFIYNTASGRSSSAAGGGALKEGEAQQPDFQEEKQVFMRELREERFREKMVMNSPWMKNMSQDRVQQINEEYQRWKDEGPAAPVAEGAAAVGAAAAE
jgi:paired amphipathic helix protein Sin3a